MTRMSQSIPLSLQNEHRRFVPPLPIPSYAKLSTELSVEHNCYVHELRLKSWYQSDITWEHVLYHD